MEMEYRDGVAIVETRTYDGRAFVAEITGTHPQYGLERGFCQKVDVTASRTNKYRDYKFALPLVEGAVYEYRWLDASSSGGENGFWRVVNGDLYPADRSDAIGRARELEAARAASLA